MDGVVELHIDADPAELFLHIDEVFHKLSVDAQSNLLRAFHNDTSELYSAVIEASSGKNPLTTMQTMGLKPGINQVQAYFQNRVKMALAGDHAMSFVSWLGGPTNKVTLSNSDVSALAYSALVDSGVKFQTDEDSNEQIQSGKQRAKGEAHLRAAADVVSGVHRSVGEVAEGQSPREKVAHNQRIAGDDRQVRRRRVIVVFSKMVTPASLGVLMT